MPTPEQIEAVAQVLDPYWWTGGFAPGIPDKSKTIDPEGFEQYVWSRRQPSIDQATAVIAAYEATRPVVSDEEIIEAWIAMVPGGPDHPWIPGSAIKSTLPMLLRYVRARLEGE